MRFSLRSLTIGFLLLFFLVMTASGTGLFLLTRRTVYQLAEERIAAVSLSLAPSGESVTQRELIADIDSLSQQRDTGDLGMALYDRTGRQIAGNVHPTRRLPLGFSSLNRSDGIAGLTHGKALVRRVGSDRLAVLAETEPFDNYFALRFWFYIAAFGVITLVVLIGLLLFRMVVGQRITAMQRTVDAIVEGDLNERVPLTGSGDEFDRQAHAFNRMLDRIGDLMNEVRSVTDDVAHELRTPLSRLRNQLMSVQQADAQMLREHSALALAEADRLLAVFTAMLRIAEVENRERRADFAPVRLDEAARDMVEMLVPVAEDSGHDLSIDAPEAATVAGDGSLLSQLTVNLVENALRHTPATSCVTVAVAASDDRVRLIVSDNGPGIPAGEREQVLRRFVRHGSGELQGHGLGLALVHAIVRLHKGRLLLEDASPGLRIVAEFAAIQ